ncbi:MAG: low specificity L-threonine aldolase [Spirochaetales bacterium]|nr:low specificity L-threonine aldolase [Spirochaetales bacterium]
MTTRIDLRSDTITRPSREMRKAMARAEVGDDVYAEDPTVNELQKKAAQITGKKDALFVSSGSMGNLIPLMILAGRGKEVLTHKNSHIIHYELSSCAAIAGVTPIQVEGERGILTPKNLESHLRDESAYDMPRVGLIEIENSHNKEGGTCYTKDQLKDLQDFAKKNRIPIHMDGARLFNASLASNTPVKKICSYVDSLTFCLSKGLGAPAGSMLCGDTPFINEARRVRKMLGGGMRQVGILAAAGIYGLENNITRLIEDHENAKKLAMVISETSWGHIDLDTVETNIIYFDTPGRKAPEIVDALGKKGIIVGAMGPRQIRMVTSLAVRNEEIDEACKIIRELKL